MTTFADTTKQNYKLLRILKSTWNINEYKSSLILSESYRSLIVFPEQIPLVDKIYFVKTSMDLQKCSIEFLEVEKKYVSLRHAGLNISLNYEDVLQFDTSDVVRPISLVSHSDESYMAKILKTFGDVGTKSFLFASKKDAKRYMINNLNQL